jgi:aspartyl-tRNA synthetase
VRAIGYSADVGPSRSFWDKLEEQAKQAGAAGLAWLTVEADGSLKGPVAKFLTPESTQQLIAATESKTATRSLLLPMPMWRRCARF